MEGPSTDQILTAAAVALARDLVTRGLHRVLALAARGSQAPRALANGQLALATADRRAAIARDLASEGRERQEHLVAFLDSPDAIGVAERMLAVHILERKRAFEATRPLTPIKAASRKPRRRSNRRQSERVHRSQGFDVAPPSLTRESNRRLAALDEMLRRELHRGFALWLDSSDAYVQTTAEAVYGALHDEVNTLVSSWTPDQGFGTGSLEELERWVESIEPRLRLLEETNSIQPLLRFEWQLRQQAAAYHSRLVAPHLDREVRMTYDQGYVEPWLVPANSLTLTVDERAEARVPSTVCRAGIDRTVIIGSPGAGKSTFASKLAHDLSSRYEDRLVAGKLLTPVVIVLRDYALHRASTSCSLREYVEVVCRLNYQLLPPPGAVEYLLSQGRLLLIFDGLDELPSIAGRQQVRNDIESLCNLYPAIHVLVTSRVVGYAHTSLDPKIFEAFALDEFDAQQVSEYAHRWFDLRDELPHAERSRRAAGFLRESERHAMDLRTNPLMLALLCALYRGTGSLPRNRPAIYRRCSDLLLRTWDASREIEVERPLGEHLERALRYIAHWIYARPSLQSGVSEQQLVSLTADYIAERRTGDMDEARAAAASFINFCRGRPWILVEVGHDKNERPLFAFTHRTFLEFFAAEHIVRTSRTPVDLVTALRPLLTEHESDVLPHLAVQIAHDEREGAGDEVLRLLLATAGGPAGIEETFAVRSLRFIVPEPETRAMIGEAAARYCTAVGFLPAAETGMPVVIQELTGCLEANVRWCASGFYRFLASRLGESSEGVRAHATLTVVAKRSAGPGSDAWVKACTAFRLEQAEDIIRVASENRLVASELLLAGDVSLTWFARTYGPDGWFTPFAPASWAWCHVGLTWTATLASVILTTAVAAPAQSVLDIEACGDALIVAAQSLITTGPPWALVAAVQSSPWPDGESTAIVLDEAPLSSLELFGFICLMLPFAEQSGETWQQPAKRWPLVQAVIELVLMRALLQLEGFPAYAERYRFDDAQRGFLRRWVKRELSTVDRSVRADES
jgi:hypothetical protein